MAEKKKIVCIDDDQTVIDLVKYILEHAGHEVTGAIGGWAGLEAVRKVLPDLVLLDLSMPAMDGWDVHQLIKLDESMKHIPIVILSSRATSVDKAYARQIAGAEFIIKPFDSEEFLKRVTEILARAKV